MVYAAGGADGAGSVEKLFGQGGLAGVHMGNQADIDDIGGEGHIRAPAFFFSVPIGAYNDIIKRPAAKRKFRCRTQRKEY